MVARPTLRRTLLGRDVAVAFGVLVGLYGFRYVALHPIQIPSYLLVVAYDVVEMAIPHLTPVHPIGVPVFLYLLAVVGAGVGRAFRSGEEVGDAVIRAVGGVFLVVAALSVLFGAYVGGPIVVPGRGPTPLAVTGATGIVFAVAGWWLLVRVGS